MQLFLCYICIFRLHNLHLCVVLHLPAASVSKYKQQEKWKCGISLEKT